MRLELRDLLYTESFSATPTQPQNKSSFRNQISAELGLSIFLPTSFDP